jgi:uncharacterized membrane protein
MLEIFIHDFLFYILPFFLILIFIGIISQPVSSIFFRKNLDGGFANSIILGLLSISWISYVIGILISSLIEKNYFSIYTPAITLGLITWGGVNYIVISKEKTFLRNLKDFKFVFPKKFLVTFILLIFNIFWLYLLKASNYVYSPFGSENHMNLGILNSFMYSNNLPPEDFWFSGEPLNYYFFGHYLIYVLIHLLNFEPSRDFAFISIFPASIFITALLIFVLTLIKSLNIKLTKLNLVVGSIIFYLFSILINPILSIVGLLENLKEIKSFEQISKNYADYTIRIIDFTISENFNYQIIFNPLHALTINLITGVLFLNALYYFSYSKEAINIKNKYLVFISAIVGFSGLINTWDVIVYGSIFVTSLVFFKLQEVQKNFKNAIKSLLLLVYPFFIIMFPWLYFYIPSAGVPSINTKVSNLIELFFFWGIYIIIFGFFIYTSYKKEINFKWGMFLAIFGFLIIFGLEIIYFKDYLRDTDWYRANTYYKFSNVAILLFSTVFPVVITYFISKGKRINFVSLIILLVLLSSWINYPIFFHASGQDIKYTGILNQNKLILKYNSETFDLINYLNSNAEKNINIIEGIGKNSYISSNFVSVFTGIPSVMGFPDHQITWRSNLTFVEDLENRILSVPEIYTGTDIEKSRKILKKYHVDYIVLTKSERDIYDSKLQEDKLNKLGEIVFEKGDAKLIKIID